jgi:hypothetical protein
VEVRWRVIVEEHVYHYSEKAGDLGHAAFLLGRRTLSDSC